MTKPDGAVGALSKVGAQVPALALALVGMGWVVWVGRDALHEGLAAMKERDGVFLEAIDRRDEKLAEALSGLQAQQARNTEVLTRLEVYLQQLVGE